MRESQLIDRQTDKEPKREKESRLGPRGKGEWPLFLLFSSFNSLWGLTHGGVQ
jgi:hypothetical protein